MMALLAAEIVSQEHKMAYTYIETLQDREQLEMAESYLQEDGVVFMVPTNGVCVEKFHQKGIVDRTITRSNI